MKKIILSIIASLVCVFFLSTPVSAAGISMRITPSKSTIYELGAGENAKGAFTVTNNGIESIKIRIEIKPYSINATDYSSNFEVENNYNKLAKWVTTKVIAAELAPNESKEIPYTITIPDDVPSGGQYAAIIVSIDEEQLTATTSNLTIIGQLAHIIYTHLSGDTRQEGNILNNNIPSVNIGAPITASSTLNNTGNVDLDAEYLFEIIDINSNETVYTNTNDTERRILPETTRYVVYTWEGSPQLGIFKVRQTIKYNNESSTKEAIVFVCPFWLVVLIVLFIISAIIWLIGNQKRRKYND